MKQTRFKRVVSGILAAMMLFTLVVPSVGAAAAGTTILAASENLLANPGFEDAAPGGDTVTGAWGVWNYAQRVDKTAEADNVRTGNYALKVWAKPGEGSSSEQGLTLTAGKTYTFKVWAKLNKAPAGAVAPEIGIKSTERVNGQKTTISENKVQVTSTQWKEYSLEYTYERGDACVYVYSDPAVAQDVIIYADDASLTLKDDGTQPPVEPEPEVPAASGIVPDPGFEKAPLGPGANPVVGHWNDYNYTRVQNVKHAGAYAVKSAPRTESTISMKLDNLIPGTLYELSAYTMGGTASKGSANPLLGVKTYGGREVNTPVNCAADAWKQSKVEFTYTDASLTPEIYIWTEGNNSDFFLYVDDMDVRALRGITDFQLENGKMQVKVAGHTGNLTAEEFSASYTVAGGSAKALPLTAEAATADSITLNFAKIPTTAEQQDVTVTLSYSGTAKQQITGSFVVEKDESKRVVADMVSATIENGTATVVLNKEPNPLPAAKDFEIAYTENNGEKKLAEIESVDFAADTKTATVKFAPVQGDINGAKTVKISVTYNNKTIEGSAFTIDKVVARTFYVAANGNDANEGLSEAKPFQTIDKINSLTLKPGDRVLFKKGDTFEGTLKPKGSGRKGAPIVIASYGTAAQKPHILAKGQWDGQIHKAGAAETAITNATFRGAVWLKDVEYYEIRDLELEDPLYDAKDTHVNQIPYYSAGIRVVNENMGDLNYFVFDNLTIHGFRGNGYNFGKSGGGIQFNVLVDEAHKNENDPQWNIPSAIHDISITNCEIYECGRSGINFLNPWGRRTPKDGKWPGSKEGILPWYPFQNFYMANNVIHHIDGDGLILDTVDNAVVEKNLCYETAIHLGYMAAAVGFFNWNSDDTYFQYNEVFNVGKDATNQQGGGTGPELEVPVIGVPGDAQGIEIDALNDRSFVQYNYVHDNYGGFMMWCNTFPFYPSYDGVVRYNISENDHMKEHGVFDTFNDMYNSETYNNVFYMNPETAVKNNQLYLFHNHGGKGEHKMYNNIFYLTGNRAYPANHWGPGTIDWQNNIFYNITGAPAGSNMTITADDPLFVDPGKGYNEAKPVTKFRGLDQMRKDLEGYKLQNDSIAIDGGRTCPSMEKEIPVGMTGETIPMHDFFGKTVTGIPDIGAHESDIVPLKVVSNRYDVNQKNNTITVPNTALVSELLASLVYSDQLKVALLRGNAAPDAAGCLLAGDVVKVATKDGKETRTYTVAVVKQSADAEIPVSQMTAHAGNEEKSQGRDLAENVLKDDDSIWHTAWGGSSRDQHWIYLKLNDDAPAYKVTGLSFLPRQNASVNGVITSYEIYGSNDGAKWNKITNGTWELADRSNKVVTLAKDADQNYRYYKLTVLDAGSDNSSKFASLQRMRLLGHEVAAEKVPAAPAAVKAGKLTATTAEIRWNAPADATAIAAYLVKDASGKVLARVPAGVTAITLTGLQAKTQYIGLTVTAENAYGAASAVANVPAFTTTDSDTPVDPQPEGAHGEQTVIRHNKQTGSNNKFTYSQGNWVISGAHSYSTVGTKDAVWYQVDFVGNAIDVYSGKNAPMGIVEYFIDGKSVGEVSLYNPTNIDETFIKQFAGLTDGPHTFKAVATGKRDAKSTDSLIDAAKIVVYHEPYTVTGAASEQTALTMKKGQSAAIALTLTPDYTTLADVTFASENDAVATVDAAGVVKSVKAGNTKINVLAKTTGTKLLTIPVTVEETVAALGGSIVDIDTQYTQDRYEEVKAMHTTSADLTAWRNDKALSALALVTKDCALQNVSITASPLTAADGSIISADNIETTFIKSTMAYDGGYPGYFYPGKPVPEGHRSESSDILYQTTPMDVPFNAVQPVWVKINVPKSAKAGVYTTTITVNADELAQPLTFTYNLTVENAVLKDASEFRNSFDLELWQYPYSVAEYYGVEPFSAEHFEILRPHMEIYQELGGHAITATIIEDAWQGQTYSKNEIHYPSMIKWVKTPAGMTYDYTDFDKWVEFCKTMDMGDKIVLYSVAPWNNAFTYWENGKLVSESFESCGGVGGPRYTELWTHFLTDLAAHLTEKGWFDAAYIGIDERGLDHKALDVIYSVENSEGKKFKTAGALNRFEQYRDVAMRMTDINIGAHVVEGNSAAAFDRFLHEREALGLRTTLYTCTEHSPSNFSLSAPVESYWTVLNAGEKTAGMLRWAYDAWVEDPLRDTTHCAFEPGDCFLVFPDERDAEHPVSKTSVRLERMAQGVRDVNKLRQMVEKYPDMQTDVDDLYAQMHTTAGIRHNYLNKEQVAAISRDTAIFQEGLKRLTAKYLNTDPDAHRYIPVNRMDITDVHADSETNPALGNDGPAAYAFDGNVNTMWHTSYGADQTSCPHQISWKIGEAKNVSRIQYVARPTGKNGLWKEFTVEGRNGDGEWINLGSRTLAQAGSVTVNFVPTKVTELRVTITQTEGDTPNTFASAAEIRTFYTLPHTGPVNEVIRQIDALGTIDLSKEAEVEAARAAFNRLSSAQREMVTNLDKLIAAEKALATMFEVEGASLSVSGDIAVNFFVNFSKEMAKTANVVLTVKGQEPVVLPAAQAEKTDNGLKFTASMAVRQMTDNIELKAMKDGKQIGEAVNFSIREYADILLAGKYPETTQTFVKAMLFHGAAMQQLKNHNPENLATKGLDMKALEDAAKAVDGNALYAATIQGTVPAGLTLHGVSLSLKDETSLNFFFVKDEGVKADQFNFDTGIYPNAVTENDRFICVKVDDIAASRLDDIITLTVDGLAVTYSPLTYARSVILNKDADPALDLVARSLVVYNATADAMVK